MRTTIAVIVLCAVSFIRAAVTEQWYITLSDMGDPDYAQIVADGKGGCALLYYSTNDQKGLKLIWIDKKQQIIYQKEFAVDLPIAISACDGKQLTYIHGLSRHTVVVVDTKGNEILTLGTMGGWLDEEAALNARIAWQVPRDKKGAFALVDIAEEGDPVYRLTYSTFK
jgi:hypothetical protein